jgi:putative FmdB family regulatory protein
MPLYEYQCSKCEKVHEVVQKFSDAPLEKCPECDGPISKLISMSSFALKGSGWYTTDYKRAGSKAPAPEAPSAAPATPAPATAAPATPAKSST